MGKRTKPRILVLGSGGVSQLERAGAKVARLGLGDDRAQQAIRAGEVDGLLLTGGGDVDPLLYDKKRHPRVYGVSEQRDLAEWNAITAADEAGIAMMGICRGAQILNVAFGGTLHQNLPDTDFAHNFHSGGDHRVRAAEGSRLAAAWGTGDDATRWVISIHHQAVKDVAPGFVATGWGLDGTIEAIEAVDGWVLGVQFHPEMAWGDEHHQRIFDRFVSAAAKIMGLHDWQTPSRPDRVRTQTAVRREAAIVKADTLKPKRHRAQLSRQSTWQSPVLTRWRCFRCQLDFDERDDHVDHMLFLHGFDVFSEYEPA